MRRVHIIGQMSKQQRIIISISVDVIISLLYFRLVGRRLDGN